MDAGIQTNRAERLQPPQVVDLILESLTHDDVRYSVTIPAGVSDLKSMELLNARSQESLGVDVIHPETIKFYRLMSSDEAAPLEDRRIEVVPIVQGSQYLNRMDQENILADNGMTFAREAHQIIVGAAARLKLNKDIFEGYLVRGAFTECAIMTHPALGIRRHEYRVDDVRFSEMAASGEPAS